MTARVHVTWPVEVEPETGSLMFPRVLSENLARRPGVVISASSEAPGWPALAALSDNTYERWRPTSMNAHWMLDFGGPQLFNACGIAAHNLGSSNCSVELQVSSDNVVWNGLSWFFTPQTDGPLLIIIPFHGNAWRFARLVVYGGNLPTIGHIRFGRTLTLEHGIAGPHVPLDYARRAPA